MCFARNNKPKCMKMLRQKAIYMFIKKNIGFLNGKGAKSSKPLTRFLKPIQILQHFKTACV